MLALQFHDYHIIEEDFLISINIFLFTFTNPGLSNLSS